MKAQMQVAFGAGVLALLGADMSSGNAEAAVQRRPAAARASLCARGETVVFQCRVAGGRMVAVCGGGAGAGRYAQYRIGRPGALDLSYPTARSGAGTMVHSLIPYSGGGEAQLHFTTGGNEHLVYSRVLRTRFDRSGRNDAAFSAGVAAWQGDRRVSSLRCSDDANVDLAAAERFMPEGEPVNREH